MNQMIDPSTTATGLLSSHNIIPQQTFHPAENAASMQNSAQNLSRSFAATSSCNVRKSAVMKQIQKDQRRQQSNPPRPPVNNLDITSNSIGAPHQIPQSTGLMFQSEKRNPNHSLLSTGQLLHPSQVGGYLLPGSTGNFLPAHPQNTQQFVFYPINTINPSQPVQLGLHNDQFETNESFQYLHMLNTSNPNIMMQQYNTQSYPGKT